METGPQKGILEYNCKTCESPIHLKYPYVLHAGFGNVGFMYCNVCGKVITWSSFDSKYRRIVGEKHPWTLTEKEKEKIELSVIDCDCGGHFSFSAKPRCLNCKSEIPINENDIYYYNLNGKIDGEKINIWK